MKTELIVVLGAGESGTGAAILAQAKGKDVFVSDSGAIKPAYKALLDANHIAWEENGHTPEKILCANEVIKSPGIPETAPLIVQLREKGISVISEIEFAARYTKAKMICITGSNGKTTTTSLIYDMLCRAGLDVGLADIAILLNITPDHLDRSNFEFQNYVNAKFRITRNQTERDAFIYWSEDPVIDREIERIRPCATLYPFGSSEKHNVAYTDGSHLVVAAKKEVEPLAIPLEQLALQGKHNQLNSMAASIAAQLLNIKNDTIRESLRCFAGVPHRLQYVATVKGVRYINDSKATNVNSCWYALEAMTTPTVLILGGKDKGNDYSEIDRLVLDKCHTLVFMGLHNEKLEEHFGALGYADGKTEPQADRKFFSTHNLHDAVMACADSARDGDTVLLSPCCASFDLFNSYEDRGDRFMNAVRHL